MYANCRHSKATLPLIALMLGLLACAPIQSLAEPTASSLPQLTATAGVEQAAPTTEPTSSTAVEVPEGWDRFTDEEFGLSFIYPEDWNGPEIHRWEEGVAAEIGTDIVYPFGTGREDRQYSVPDAYFISIQFTQNRQGSDGQQSVDNQPWAEGYFELLELQDGQSITTPRSLTTRLRQVEVGEYSGLEYIATLSESAQTEFFYIREALLFDENFNSIRVSGSPNNIQILEGEDWRAAYQRVDDNYQGIFHQVLDSVSSLTND